MPHEKIIRCSKLSGIIEYGDALVITDSVVLALLLTTESRIKAVVPEPPYMLVIKYSELNKFIKEFISKDGLGDEYPCRDGSLPMVIAKREGTTESGDKIKIMSYCVLNPKETLNELCNE